jgi:hypothetical protein
MLQFKTILYTVLSGLLILSFCLWICTPYSDLGMNFFTEISGIIITVFIVERILVRIKEKEELPLKIAYYNEIVRFQAIQMAYLMELHQQSIPGNLPQRIEDFLQLETINKMLWSIDMNGSPAVLPKIEVATYIHNELKRIIDHGNKILDRYSGQLEPKLHLLVHSLTNSNFYTTTVQVNVLRQFDLRQGIPRPSVLACYTAEPQNDHFQNLLRLYKWCENFYAEQKDIATLNKPFTYHVANYHKHFPLMKDEDALRNELEKFAAYQGRP